ncbi:glutaredoxin [Clavulina sp. PMI_390]|nr:glutaredoxin [Clavulina sp. PMI_390]
MRNFVDGKPEHLSSPEAFKAELSKDLNKVSLLSFWASWAEPCKTMNQVVKELATKYSEILVLSIEAEGQSEIAESFDIESVPTFVILRGHTLLQRIVGADAAALTRAVETHGRAGPKALSTTTQAPAPAPSSISEKAPAVETPEELTERLTRLMNKDKRVLFMKGTPDAPECGFSRQFVALLRERNVAFSYFNIYTDESVRQGLKVVNKWPTFPQFIVNGEFIGGLDVIKELIANDEFEEAADIQTK